MALTDDKAATNGIIDALEQPLAVRITRDESQTVRVAGQGVPLFEPQVFAGIKSDQLPAKELQRATIAYGLDPIRNRVDVNCLRRVALEPEDYGFV